MPNLKFNALWAGLSIVMKYNK